MQRRVTDRAILKGYSPYCLFLYQVLQILKYGYVPLFSFL